MKITIGHLYPDLLNLYGDRGNIQCMKKKAGVAGHRGVCEGIFPDRSD